MTSVRIGIDRPSCATNVLINRHAEVGRQRDALIYAPSGAREHTFGAQQVKCGVEDASIGVRDALAWKEFAAKPANVIAGVDLMAMDKYATRCGVTNARDVTAFRRATPPIRLKTGERRAENAIIDTSLTFGRPSHRRLDEEIRYARCDPGTKISSLIQGEFVDEWLNERLARRAEDATARPRLSVASAKDQAALAKHPTAPVVDPNKKMKKMKKFLTVKSKVAAMGFF
jgi:hypothetical protein